MTVFVVILKPLLSEKFTPYTEFIHLRNSALWRTLSKAPVVSKKAAYNEAFNSLKLRVASCRLKLSDLTFSDRLAVACCEGLFCRNNTIW